MPDYVPNFDSPFRLNPDGSVATVEVGSTQDVAAQIVNVLSCPQGAKFADPDFGIPWPVFDLLDIDTEAIASAIQTLVPDATIDVVQQAITQVTSPQQVTLNVTGELNDGFGTSIAGPPPVSNAPFSVAPTGPTGPSGPTGPTGSPPSPVTLPIIT